jgi:hypothetical protein
MSTNDPDPREAEQPRRARRSGYQRKKADKFDRLAVELEELGKVLRTVSKKGLPENCRHEQNNCSEKDRFL